MNATKDPNFHETKKDQQLELIKQLINLKNITDLSMITKKDEDTTL